MDIIIPKGNEDKLAEMCVRLGYKEVMFLYSPAKFKEMSKRKYGINVKFGILAKPNEIRKAKNLSEYVVVKRSLNDRHVVEKLRPWMVFDYENHSREDFIHHRNSGLNHIMCSLMKKNCKPSKGPLM